MKDNFITNFITKAWRGEERFWKVFLVGVSTMMGLLYLKSQWQVLIPFILIVTIYPLVLIPINRCRKNIDLLKNDPWFLYVANLIIMVLWIFYAAMCLFSMFVLFISWGACEVHNGEFCVSLF